MHRPIYTPTEYLAMARVSIRNAQWFKDGGNVEAMRNALERARFFMTRAKRAAAGCDVERQDMTQRDAATV